MLPLKLIPNEADLKPAVMGGFRPRAWKSENGEFSPSTNVNETTARRAQDCNAQPKCRKCGKNGHIAADCYT
jgi:hypothetical protein